MFDSKEKMDQFFYKLNKVHPNVSFSRGGSRWTVGIFGCPTDKN